MTVLTDNMKKAAQNGFINATDMADYLVNKGLPFRDAYKISGKAVAYCIQNGKVLETLTVDEYKSFSDLIDEGIFEAVDLDNCVRKRTSFGGPTAQSVIMQIDEIKKILG